MASLLTGNKFDPNADIPDLSGKVYIVTGGSAGIGFGIVAHLLQHNAAKILLLSNKKQHADEAMEELTSFGDNSHVHWVDCDLSSLKRVDKIAKELAQSESRVDALILNAGLGVGKYWETEDGIDSHFQINALAQFHLALTLLPVLQKTPHSRLVFQSSDLHRAAPPHTNFMNLEEMNKDIGAAFLYNRTKLAQVLFVLAFKRRMEAGKLGFDKAGVTRGEGLVYVNATHPGAVSTDQQEQAVEAYGALGKIGVMAVRPFMADPVDQGCRSVLWAATSGEVVEKRVVGKYVVPDKQVVEASERARDEGLQEKLWGLSFGVLREKLGELGYEVDVE